MSGPSPDPLLEAAVYHLSHRNFPSCRNYAVRAQSSSHLRTDADQILAVADTLSAAETSISEFLIDWYAILQIYRYSQDSHLINQQFKKLSLLLYPDENKFPFSDEAFKLVCEAGSVLSNPSKKTLFDNELQAIELKLDETFWTMCPYCYCMYEFLRVYEDCCLKCHNEKCRRGFHAAFVEPPPLDVVEKGEYTCMGFFPLGFDGSLVNEGENWNPISPLVGVKKREGEKKNDVSGAGNAGDSGDHIDISDESDDLNYGVGGRNDNDEVARTGEVQQNNCFGKPMMKRRKMAVPKNAKKLMGKGSRASRMENVAQGAEGLDLNTRAGEDNTGGNSNGNELRGVGGVEMGNDADFDTGVELLTGDDDIFVTFPDCF